MLERRIDECSITRSPELPAAYTAYEALVTVNAEIKGTKKKIASVHSILQLEELKNRKRVLRRLGFATSADVIEPKGRVACEISTGDELLLTELIFSGTFNSMEPEHCAALLSCFVFDEKVGLSLLA
jgi:ATP-dependent RNA helicase DOB1